MSHTLAINALFLPSHPVVLLLSWLAVETGEVKFIHVTLGSATAHTHLEYSDTLSDGPSKQSLSSPEKVQHSLIW